MESRPDDQQRLRQICRLLTELSTSEITLSQKAKKMVETMMPLLSSELPNQLSNEEQALLTNALAHYLRLAEDLNPFDKITPANLVDLNRIAIIIQETESSMGNGDTESPFKKRAISLIWLTIHYTELQTIFTKMGLLKNNLALADYLICPTQRLMKFHLFATDLSQLLASSLPEKDFQAAKDALSRLLLRAQGIAEMTNTVIKALDPRTGKPLITGLNDTIINQIISKIVTGILEKEPTENYVQLGIEIRNKLQEEIRIQIEQMEKSKVITYNKHSTMWEPKEKESKESSQLDTPPPPGKK